MSRKTQQGAAERADAVPGARPGPVTRLRAQPGFRAAAVVFVLTVVLGAGGPAAYAYWSQSTAVTITGSTVPPLTPVPTGVKCVNASPVRVEWPGAQAADPEVRYIVTLKAPAAGVAAVYALPLGTRSIDPYALYASITGGMSPRTASSIPVSVTVRSAIVRADLSPTTVQVVEKDLLFKSAESAAVNMTLSFPSGGPRLACNR